MMFEEPIFAACRSNDYEQVINLLAEDVDNVINHDLRDEEGLNPLDIDCKYGYLEIADVLFNERSFNISE